MTQPASAPRAAVAPQRAAVSMRKTGTSLEFEKLELQFAQIQGKLRHISDARKELMSNAEKREFNHALLQTILNPYKAIYKHRDVTHYTLIECRRQEAIRLLTICSRHLASELFNEEEVQFAERVLKLIIKIETLPTEVDTCSAICNHHTIEWLLTFVTKKTNILTNFYH